MAVSKKHVRKRALIIYPCILIMAIFFTFDLSFLMQGSPLFGFIRVVAIIVGLFSAAMIVVKGVLGISKKEDASLKDKTLNLIHSVKGAAYIGLALLTFYTYSTAADGAFQNAGVVFIPLAIIFLVIGARNIMYLFSTGKVKDPYKKKQGPSQPLNPQQKQRYDAFKRAIRDYCRAGEFTNSSGTARCYVYSENDDDDFVEDKITLTATIRIDKDCSDPYTTREEMKEQLEENLKDVCDKVPFGYDCHLTSYIEE